MGQLSIASLSLIILYFCGVRGRQIGNVPEMNIHFEIFDFLYPYHRFIKGSPMPYIFLIVE